MLTFNDELSLFEQEQAASNAVATNNIQSFPFFIINQSILFFAFSHPKKKNPQVNWISRKSMIRSNQLKPFMMNFLKSRNKFTTINTNEIIAIIGARLMSGPLSLIQEIPPIPARTKKMDIIGVQMNSTTCVGSCQAVSNEALMRSQTSPLGRSL